MIGIFDSGIGGLSIWQAINQQLPNTSTLYVADQAWAPYGNRPPSDIQKRSRCITQFLINRGAQIVVIACNTATVTTTIDNLRHEFSQTNFVGVEPPIKLLAKLSQTKQTALFATQATCVSKRLKHLIQLYATNLDLTIVPTVEWANLVENNFPSPQTEIAIHQYLKPLTHTSIDYIGLGCTHYPYLIPYLQSLYPQFSYLSVDLPVANRVKSLSGNLQPSLASSYKFLTTSSSKQSLKSAVTNLLHLDSPVECIDI